MSQFDEEEVQQFESSGPRLYHNQVVGHLLLVWAVGYKEPGTAPSKFKGQEDAIVVDVVDLSAIDPETGQPPTCRGVWWRPGGLIQALRPRIGRDAPLLAMMSTRPSNFGNPAYELIPAHTDPQCRALAEAWMNAHPNWRAEGQAPPPGVSVPAAPVAPRPAPAVAPLAQESVMDRLRRLGNQASAQASRLQAPAANPYEKEPPF